LGELSGRLGKLEALLDETKRQLAEYLRRRESPPSEARVHAGNDASGEIVERLDAVRRQTAAFTEAIGRIEERLDAGFHRLAEILLPKREPRESSGEDGAGRPWRQAILGPDLAADPELDDECRSLLAGVLEGDPNARSLAGELLIFQATPGERLPPLLKGLGEAYYRWQPKTAPGTRPLEESLVRWLRRTCEAAGIFNSVELVHPGERFDSTRHSAATRGVEITQVQGWVVLRDNGKVYTKATVTAR
jgi:hypothetical protein